MKINFGISIYALWSVPTISYNNKIQIQKLA